MNKKLLGAIVGFGLLVLGIQTAAAQALAGRQLPDKPRVGIGYYKVPPGKHDEWLALYKQWHRPIMDAQIEAGVTLSSTVYVLSSHQFNGDYDFAIVNVSPAEPRSLGISRGELIQRLFPDIEAYVAGEKRRWELTVNHADTSLVEVDITEETPSVYYPIIDGRIVR
ncbi:hypothetical protein LDO26_15280 [Luteimonas sp. BDR2-5]|uniref:hypothetical protein n=1 Tax=Proluteimonas luteida TaxID=2878685 RepID=UPI001E4BFBFD|nr:hypothetical protein [Luteimonas sp. BDR2-5]MCD9029555.1 hypothetical protein [Luteimonas sp. BDR2-5]